jgi:hypothetical protein
MTLETFIIVLLLRAVGDMLPLSSLATTMIEGMLLGRDATRSLNRCRAALRCAANQLAGPIEFSKPARLRGLISYHPRPVVGPCHAERASHRAKYALLAE